MLETQKSRKNSVCQLNLHLKYVYLINTTLFFSETNYIVLHILWLYPNCALAKDRHTLVLNL